MKIFFFILFVSEILYGNLKLEKEIKQKLISPCCWAGTIYDLDHNPEMEEEIKNFISQGKDKNFILDYYVSIYGERVLAVPKATGFNLFVWIAPIFFALVGMTFFVKYLSPNSKQKNTVLLKTKKVLPYNDQIEKELQQMD
mgnify:CR=1 FL=1|tara:strand:+ start:8639 stop:9061 length:423 start_codon:yes stop_codon:yes gene_type:complete